MMGTIKVGDEVTVNFDVTVNTGCFIYPVVRNETRKHLKILFS